MNNTKINYEELNNYMKELESCIFQAKESLENISNSVDRLANIGILSGTIKNSLDVISGVIESTSSKISTKLTDYKSKIENVYLTSTALEQNFGKSLESYLDDFTFDSNQDE